MLHSSDKKLPDYNGTTYTYKDLAKDLVKYSLLSNEAGGAIGFRKLIPLSLLDDYGVTKNFQDFSEKVFNDDTNLKLLEDIFVKQFFQHNPQEAKSYNWNYNTWSKDTYGKDFYKLNDFTMKKEGHPKYISIKKGNKLLLFELGNIHKYKRINILGDFGINEYDLSSENVESLIEGNNNPNKVEKSMRSL